MDNLGIRLNRDFGVKLINGGEATLAKRGNVFALFVVTSGAVSAEMVSSSKVLEAQCASESRCGWPWRRTLRFPERCVRAWLAIYERPRLVNIKSLSSGVVLLLYSSIAFEYPNILALYY